jgi:hypothetical protein
MKYLHLVFLSFLVFGLSANAQNDKKNSINIGYSLTEEKSPITGGQISARGFDLGYSRYLTNKLYVDVTYGLKNFEGRNNQFFLASDEMNYFNMTIFTLGFGYDLYQSDRFILSGELAYLRQSNQELISLLESGELTIRETGRYVDHTAQAQIKARLFISENLQLVTAVAHGFRISRYQSMWFRAGLAYSF